jgi:hypothetical protein
MLGSSIELWTGRNLPRDIPPGSWPLEAPLRPRSRRLGDFASYKHRVTFSSESRSYSVSPVSQTSRPRRPRAADMQWLFMPSFHPVANQFPSLSGEGRDALVASIERHGYKAWGNPVALYHGMIWDGRARVEACKKLGIMPSFSILKSVDPVIYLLERHDRYGKPSTPERRTALDLLRKIDDPAYKQEAKELRKKWIAESRREFKLYAATEPQPCAVCKQHKQFVHAHHAFPLRLQFDSGMWEASHEHYWLCPVHHKYVHLYFSDFFGKQRLEGFLSSLSGDELDEWNRISEIAEIGVRLFRDQLNNAAVWTYQ